MSQHQPGRSIRFLVLVGASGSVGAMVRWAVLEISDMASGAVFAVNLAGSVLLGWMAGRGLLARPRWRLLGVGFCGGLTTFSTFALDVAVRLDSGRSSSAVGLAAATLVATVAAAAGGHALGRSGR